ncbi:glycerate kinase [bacterium]|nr:glycerate kinase [bacterium]
MLKFLIAPAAYKGSYSPIELCFAIKCGITEVLPDASCFLLPLADGGDGTVDSLHHLMGGELMEEEVIHLLSQDEHDSVRCQWLKLESISAEGRKETTAIIELASASGIAHLDQERLSAMNAHTRGTGQVMKRVLAGSIKKVVLTVGGSASTDGGMGILYELGARFLDSAGKELAPCGEQLEHIASVELDGLPDLASKIDLLIVTDVTNPLCGPSGAAQVYGPQKGADNEQVLLLDEGLAHYADILEKSCGRKARQLPGAGAAGGVPFGLVCALDARIESGFLWYQKLTGLEARLKDCDIVIGAEGFLDNQSLQGKGTGELARLCAQFEKPLWLVPARADRQIDWLKYHVERVKETCNNGKTATLADVQRTVAGLVELIATRN